MKTSTIEKIIKNYQNGKYTKIGNYKYYLDVFPIQWNGKMENYVTLIRKHKEGDSKVILNAGSIQN